MIYAIETQMLTDVETSDSSAADAAATALEFLATEVYPLLMKLSKNAAIILRARDPQAFYHLQMVCRIYHQKMAEDDEAACCFFLVRVWHFKPHPYWHQL